MSRVNNRLLNDPSSIFLMSLIVKLHVTMRVFQLFLDIRFSGSVLWNWHCSSVCSSLRSQHKTSKLAHQFFLNFCMKLDSHKISKLSKPDFWKKVSASQEGPKSPKTTQKGLSVLVKILSTLMYFFTWIRKKKQCFSNFLQTAHV